MAGVLREKERKVVTLKKLQKQKKLNKTSRV